MDIKELLNSENWFNYSTFYDYISNQNYDTLVEVGVWKGHSVSYLASKNPGKKIYAVDLFDEAHRYGNAGVKFHEQIPYVYDVYNETLKITNTRDLIEDIKGYSWECADKFEDNSIDFVFLDADHAYESVVKDIAAWYPKVKTSGILAGHDYNKETFPGVIQAVTEFIERTGHELHLASTGYVWWVVK